MNTIAEKLYSLLKIVLDSSEMVPALYHSTILNLVKPYLRKADDSELRTVIQYVRDDVIPFLLGEKSELKKMAGDDN